MGRSLRVATCNIAAGHGDLDGTAEAIAALRADGLDVRVLNTHLDYRAEPAVRTQQVVALLAALETSSQPTVLLGDLNAPPDAPELAPLFARLANVWGDCTTCGCSHPADAPGVSTIRRW